MKKERKTESHPTYGLIGWNRVSHSPPGAVLFDSPLRHQHYVVLTIRRAERHRDLNRDWLFGREELIQISLAPDQFADFLTSPNLGQGVACTLDRVGGKQQGECPERVESEEFKKELAEDFSDIKRKAEEIYSKINHILDESRLSKGKQREILWAVEELQQDIFSNLPYLRDSLEKSAQKIVTKAKFAVEAFTEDRVRQKGLGDINREELPRLIEGHNEE